MNVRRVIRWLIVGLNVAAPVAALGLWISGAGAWALAVIMTAHALWLIPTLWPECDWCGEVVTLLPGTEGREVWLTIDDGPDPDDTPRLLDLLDRHQARATFFFIGSKAAAHPNLVAEVLRRGLTVGNHTMTHPQFWFWAYGPTAVRREIAACQSLLGAAADVAPGWFRAPAGLKNPWVHAEMERQHLRLACWSARGLDGVATDKDRVLRCLKRQVRPGAIVLMHEGRVDAEGRRLAPLILDDLLSWLEAEGYRCALPRT